MRKISAGAAKEIGEALVTKYAEHGPNIKY